MIYLIHGVMASGKTKNIIHQKRFFEKVGDSYIMLKPETPNTNNYLKSRAYDEKIDCEVIKNDKTILDYILDKHGEVKYRKIVIDECQFLKDSDIELIKELNNKNYHNIEVFFYGLYTNFLNHPFETTSKIMCFADNIYQFIKNCWCGRIATVNARLNQDGTLDKNINSSVYSKDKKYIQLCQKHFHEEIPYDPTKK